MPTCRHPGALFKHQVLVLKGQSHVTPKAQFELTQRFDPAGTSYGHGKTVDVKRSVLHPDLKTIPHQPQVQVIGWLRPRPPAPPRRKC